MKRQILIALLVCAETLHAQSNFGAILGSVKDTSGAAVPGARLTLRNLDENTQLTAESGSFGLYAFLNLKAGRYQVTAERAGFSAGRASEILLDARQTRRADFSLEIAPKLETAVVTAKVPRIDTENGTIADAKSFEQVTRLPINSRAVTGSPFAAILTAPGVQQDGAGRLSIGGGLPLQIEFSVDGISTIYIYSHFNLTELAPSSEMVHEFRVTSVSADAAFGPLADVTIVSRGGTNQFHGSALWYHQNRALDAKIYGAPSKQQKVFNAFGASLGGPVRHNRTFFFADFEGNRRPQTGLIQQLYPSASARQGDLSGVPGGLAIDPSTGVPFPGNRIPASRINPVATRLLDHYYPLPNVTIPDAAYNYLALAPNPARTSGYDLRLDHVISAKQRVFARWSWKSQDSVLFNAPLPSSHSLSTYKTLAAGHSWSLTPELFNEIRVGFALFDVHENFPLRGRDAVADLGLLGLDLRNAGDTGGFPWFDFSESTSFARAYHYRSTDNNSRNYQFTDTLSWIRGRHIARFGADLRRLGYRATLHGGDGADDFGGFYFAAAGFSGNAFADLLLGLPTQSYYTVLGPNTDQVSTNAAFFASDTWHMSPRLTLEAGLRWEVHPPFQEAAGNNTNFAHSTADVIIPDQTLPPAPGFLAAINACPSGSNNTSCTRILTASQAGLPQTLRTTDYSDWGPRLGIAWQPWGGGGQTVLRAGVGIYTQIPLGGVAWGSTGVHTSDIRTIDNSMGANGQPLFALPNVLPQPNALGEIGREDFLLGVDPRMRDPRSYQWNFTIEHALPWRTTLRGSYIGVQSTGIPTRVDLNQVPASSQPFSWSRVPFPNWGYLGSIENLGFANYQGFQVAATHRLHQGVYLQATYTHSKNLGAMASGGATNFAGEAAFGVGVSDRFNTRYDRGDLSGARRDRILLTGIVPLPFGKGRAIGSGWHGLAQKVLGGWDLSTVSLIQSGPFLTPTVNGSADQSNTNLANRTFLIRPDRIANGNLPNGTYDQFFDKSAFAPVPSGAGRFGNSGVGVLVGPGTVAIAAGLAKTFIIADKARLRLEGTFTNLPNHPNFAPPNTNISSALFGRLTTVQSAENSGNRTGQVGARIDF
jgi:hypothetical protein